MVIPRTITAETGAKNGLACPKALETLTDGKAGERGHGQPSPSKRSTSRGRETPGETGRLPPTAETMLRLSAALLLRRRRLYSFSQMRRSRR